ncbi:MAG TPA: hypothetical protein DC049_11215 [Spirochaetia bacterium]|nr:hypothetical protein [Spirochaetia bacterium]
MAAIKIDISVMTPLQKISSLESITVGRDGLYLKAGIYCGVFLPQVPLEQGWNKNQYLEHLSLKAGLDQSGYLQSDAEIFSFQAQVFGE